MGRDSKWQRFVGYIRLAFGLLTGAAFVVWYLIKRAYKRGVMIGDAEGTAREDLDELRRREAAGDDQWLADELRRRSK